MCIRDRNVTMAKAAGQNFRIGVFVMGDTGWLHAYLFDKPGVTKDYKVEWGWDRYMVGGKLFACLLYTSRCV